MNLILFRSDKSYKYQNIKSLVNLSHASLIPLHPLIFYEHLFKSIKMEASLFFLSYKLASFLHWRSEKLTEREEAGKSK